MPPLGHGPRLRRLAAPCRTLGRACCPKVAGSRVWPAIPENTAKVDRHFYRFSSYLY